MPSALKLEACLVPTLLLLVTYLSLTILIITH